jgi:lysozyme
VSSASAAPSALPPDRGCADLSKHDGSGLDKPLGLRPGNVTHGAHVSTAGPWKALRDRGFTYAFAAAAYGGQPNAHFKDNWAMMKRCGFARGAFHFIVPTRDGASQAALFLDMLGGDHGELPATIDIERPAKCEGACCGAPCGQWTALADAWLSAVRAATGTAPMIYTVVPFWNECLCGTTRFANHPLWLGAWPKFDFPRNPGFGGWSRWTFYHYIGNRLFAGAVVDIDLFDAPPADFHAWLAPKP